jgi:hypothetical protein
LGNNKGRQNTLPALCGHAPLLYSAAINIYYQPTDRAAPSL